MSIGYYANSIKVQPQWYNHIPNAVEETNEIEILWDFSIHTDKHRRPEIILHNKREKTVNIIGVAIPADVRVKTKYTEKLST